ncbi:hypothetical protein GCM10025762_15320 [Haloechinothrix salitolerans]
MAHALVGREIGRLSGTMFATVLSVLVSRGVRACAFGVIGLEDVGFAVAGSVSAEGDGQALTLPAGRSSARRVVQ